MGDHCERIPSMMRKIVGVNMKLVKELKDAKD
jgi:hypothetical protein